MLGGNCTKDKYILIIHHDLPYNFLFKKPRQQIIKGYEFSLQPPYHLIHD